MYPLSRNTATQPSRHSQLLTHTEHKWQHTGLYRVSKSFINPHQPLSLHQPAPAFASNSLNRTDRNLTIRQGEKFLLLTIPEIEPQQWSSYLAATYVLWLLCTHSPRSQPRQCQVDTSRTTRSMSWAHLSLPPHPIQT